MFSVAVKSYEGVGLNLGAAPPNPSKITLRLKHIALVPKCDCKKGNRKKAWKGDGRLSRLRRVNTSESSPAPVATEKNGKD